MQDIEKYIPEPMLNIDIELSKKIQKRLKGKVKQCYKNAWDIVVYFSEMEKALYVEGHAVTNDDLQIEHGWVELNGCVIEPTLNFEYCEKIVYFPGIKYDRDLAESEAIAVSSLPICWERHGWGGYDSPAMLGSYIAAAEYLLKNHNPEETQISGLEETIKKQRQNLEKIFSGI